MIKPLLFAPTIAIAFAFIAQADPNSEAKFDVTAEVARPAEKVPPIGVNDFGGRGVQPAAGNLIQNAGNERPVWQNMHLAVNVKDRSFQLSGPEAGGTSWYQLWNDGFLSGAKVSIYRIVDKDGKPLPVKDGRGFENIGVADRVILVGKSKVIPAGEEGFPKGGWVVDEPPPGKEANRVYLSADAPELQEFDYVVLEKDLGNFDMEWVHERVRGIKGPKDRPIWYWNPSNEETRFSFASYDGNPPAGMVDPGNSCMLVEPPPEMVTISQTCFIGVDQGAESLFYTQMEPGKDYRLEVWMKQEGLGNGGAVTFSIQPEKTPGHGQIRQSFDVTSQWAKYTYDFVAPERPKGKHYGPAFSFTGPGKLWMDNARLFRYDSAKEAEAPYTPDPDMLKALVDSQPPTGNKGTHRIWVLSRDITMDSLLSLHASSRLRPNWRTVVSSQNKELSLPQELMFDVATGDSPETRVIPHIVMQHIVHDEQDWLNFVEYLAAPYDPKADKPETKPWAYKRYVQRGEIGTPWTDEFREILIEFGNETWHNGANEDWLGFAPRGAIFKGGQEYGLFCNYLANHIKSSPWWMKAGLDSKVKFVLGGAYNGKVKDGEPYGYGELAAAKAPLVNYVGRANYVGPKWETKDKPLSEFNNEGLLSTILGYAGGIENDQGEAHEAQKLLETRGVKYDYLAYEGGPSGYSVDRETRSMPGVAETAEKYGKSQAMAVASLDAWLGSYLQGWTVQNYFSFQQGNYWSSHTMMSDGFRAHASWLAMKLRNHFAKGALMKVVNKQGPTIMYKTDSKKAAAEVPLIGVYAMQDGNRWSVFVLSRKIDGRADDVDFGDGFTPVSLHLPFKSAGKVTLHKISSDPRANNIEGENVRIESQPIDAGTLSDGNWQITEATGGDKRGLPPAAIYLYVFEDVK